MNIHNALIWVFTYLFLIYRKNLVESNDSSSGGQASESSQSTVNISTTDSSETSKALNNSDNSESTDILKFLEPSTKLEPIVNKNLVDFNINSKSSTDYYTYHENNETKCGYYICKQGYLFSGVRDPISDVLHLNDYNKSNIIDSTNSNFNERLKRSNSICSISSQCSVSTESSGCYDLSTFDDSEHLFKEQDVDLSNINYIWKSTTHNESFTKSDNQTDPSLTKSTEVYAHYVIVGLDKKNKNIFIHLTDDTIKRFTKKHHYELWKEIEINVKQKTETVDVDKLYKPDYKIQTSRSTESGLKLYTTDIKNNLKYLNSNNYNVKINQEEKEYTIKKNINCTLIKYNNIEVWKKGEQNLSEPIYVLYNKKNKTITIIDTEKKIIYNKSDDSTWNYHKTENIQSVEPGDTDTGSSKQDTDASTTSTSVLTSSETAVSTEHTSSQPSEGTAKSSTSDDSDPATQAGGKNNQTSAGETDGSQATTPTSQTGGGTHTDQSGTPTRGGTSPTSGGGGHR